MLTFALYLPAMLLFAFVVICAAGVMTSIEMSEAGAAVVAVVLAIALLACASAHLYALDSLKAQAAACEVVDAAQPRHHGAGETE